MKTTHAGVDIMSFAIQWSKEFEAIRKKLLKSGADLSKIKIIPDRTADLRQVVSEKELEALRRSDAPGDNISLTAFKIWWGGEFDQIRKQLLNSGADLSKIGFTFVPQNGGDPKYAFVEEESAGV